jgi:perosamine synthetase
LQGPREFKHEDIGFNYRMSNLHAAIGLAQTERAAEYIAMRINNGEMYRKFLSKVPGISFQEDSPGYKNTYWMNAVVINKEEYGHDRDELIAYLNESNVDTRKLFIGMHRQPSLIKYGCKFDDEYLVCDMLSHNGLYLPSSSSLTKEEIFDICKLISGFRN